jgi:hypothetical protein
MGIMKINIAAIYIKEAKLAEGRTLLDEARATILAQLSVEPHVLKGGNFFPEANPGETAKAIASFSQQ